MLGDVYTMSEKNKYVDINTGDIYPNAEKAMRAKELKKIEEHEQKIKEANEKNPPFIQLTKGISPSALSRIANENAISIQVLMFFFENMDDYNFIMVSQKTIANSINKTRQAVNTAVKVLEKHGAIGVAKVSNANLYIINPSVAWQKGFKHRGVVKIRATVLLGKEENEKLFERLDKSFEENNVKSLKIGGVSTKLVAEKPQKEQMEVTKEVDEVDLDEMQAMYEEFEENKENEERDY